jgi:hypothetical protein
LTREDSRDQSAVDISWLGRAGATLPRIEMLPDQAHRFQWQPAPKPAESPPSIVSISLETVHVSSEEAPSAPESSAAELDVAPERTPDVTLMHERYPLLRNAL